MYEKILVPLDGSALAEVALPYAEEMAGRLGSEVTILSVSESEDARNYYPHQLYIQELFEATKRRAERYLEKPGDRVIKVRSEMLVGHPAENIVDYAEKEDTGLIVMATHGRSGTKRWSLGSVADKVVRATKRPVALIRAKGVHPDMRDKGMLNKALVPLDGSKESEAVVPYIEELALKLKAEIVLLYILEANYEIYQTEQLKQLESLKASGKDYIERMAAQLKQRGITTNVEFREGLPGAEAAEIIQLADEICVDMVAMSTHGRSGVSRWAFGSVADKVLHEGNTPLLLVRTP